MMWPWLFSSGNDSEPRSLPHLNFSPHRPTLVEERDWRTNPNLPSYQDEARLRAIASLAEGALFFVDAAGCVVDALTAFQTFTGRSTHDARHFGIAHAVEPHAREHFVTLFREGALSERPFELTAPIACAATGLYHTCVLRVSPVLSEYELLKEWAVLLMDVEDQVWVTREAKDVARRREDLSRFEGLGTLAGGLAHQFNNLLHGVLGHAELIGQKIDANSQLQNSVQTIMRCAERAADTCRQMMAFSGRGHFMLEPCDLNEIANGLELAMNGKVEAKTVLSCELARSLPAVRADPRQLRQALSNLVQNALDSLRETGGTIRVGTGSKHFSEGELRMFDHGERLRPGRYVYLEVVDDGPGITADALPRIFEPFFTTRFAGRGLGLPAVLGIAKSGGGAVHVLSEEGKGTHVRVLLPALAEAADAPERSAEGGDVAGATVLVVDDDPNVRWLARIVLESAGAHVLTADCGEHALELHERMLGRIDAVLLDLTLPGMDGSATLRRLRACDAKVPVILMGTPLGELGHTATPYDKFLSKPWHAADVTSALASALAGRAPRSRREGVPQSSSSGTFARVDQTG